MKKCMTHISVGLDPGLSQKRTGSRRCCRVMLSGVFLSDLHMLRSSECWPLKNSKPLEHPPDLNSVSSWGRDGESIPFIKAAVFHGEA